MPKKKGLGRGMEAIFLDNSPEDSEKVTTLRVSEIEPRRSQPRKNFDAEALSQLADSIAANGVIQPIIVRESENSGFYQIIAGERRWRAAKQAGLSEVPVVVVDADDRKAAEYALIENIQREDLNPVEEARGIKSLIDDCSLTQEETARRLGRSRAAVTNSLRLLELPEKLLDMLADKSLSAGHARALLGLCDKSSLEAAAEKVVSSELSVRQTEELVRRLNSEKAEKPKENEVEESYYRSLEEKLTSALGCRVRINRGKRRKSLSIAYRSTDELEAILEKLTKE